MAVTCVLLTPALQKVDVPFDCVDITYLGPGTLHFAFTRISSCITALITLERCLSIVAPLQVSGIVSPKRITVIIVCIFGTLLLSATPVYVVNRMGMKFSTYRNKSLIGIVFLRGYENVEKIAIFLNNVCIPFGAFLIVSLCTIIISTQLNQKTEWRKTCISDARSDKIAFRNKRVAKMVVTISTLFIVCFIPTTIIMLAAAFEPEMLVNGKYSNLAVMIAGFSYVLESINSSMNIFIYFHMSSKYRRTFRSLFSKDEVDND